ncbi:MAG: helix-turn-helix transcriptional regulator [Bacteroidetes bacterium]|nr:helix-turn-helix transcriptional regulator [Bacteroidota bacterium]
MNYSQFLPDTSIAKYIDAFWKVSGESSTSMIERILPDGCVDIIFNLGNDCKTDNGAFVMQSAKVYFVGTMTTFKETIMDSDTNLFGIRFKPGAFSAFYKFNSLHALTDKTIELEKSFGFDLQKICSKPLEYLNKYFTHRLNKENKFLLDIVKTIEKRKGQIKVDTLATQHYTTVRQLERCFKQYIGISPKEFIRVVRYQHTMAALQNRKQNQSLLSIAFECGYYDHAHLCNELKRYNGITPSLL